MGAPNPVIMEMNVPVGQSYVPETHIHRELGEAEPSRAAFLCDQSARVPRGTAEVASPLAAGVILVVNVRLVLADENTGTGGAV